MPLQPGSSKATISHNIKEMSDSGHPHDQAVAAALHNAHPNKKAEKAECSADVQKSAADLIKSGWAPGAAVAEARKKHGVEAGAKFKHTMKPMHKMMSDDPSGAGMDSGGGAPAMPQG